MRYVLIIVLALAGHGSIAQENFQAIFDQLTQDGEWEAVPSLLDRWADQAPESSQRYVAEFNYLFHECRKEVVEINDVPPQDGSEYLVINDTATGEPAGYMYSIIVYDDDLFNQAISVIDAGLQKHPRRLDMHFGKIYVLRERGEIDLYIQAIVEVIQKHQTYHDQWLWTNDQPVQDPDDRFTGAVQDHCYALFNKQNPLIDGVERISTMMTQLYPGDVRFYSNVGACKLIRQEFAPALEFFMKAHEIRPDDPVVLSNIGYALLQMKQWDDAIRFYERLEKAGNEDQAAFARGQIDRIQQERQTKR